MRFQGTALYGGEKLLEPCCSLPTSGSTQIYQNINGVEWQINLYTSSIQLGGASGSDEQFQLYVTGSTKHAIVACVGGGGSAFSKTAGSGGGFGGGGGGVIVSSSLTLTEGTLYAITVGQGGDGFTCPSPSPCDPNGNDGNQSRFAGGNIDMIAGGGKGSTIADGSGGSSGTPNIQSGSSAGGSGAAFPATGSGGSFGLSVFLGQDAPIFRAGGGGSQLNDASGEPWGGNSSYDNREGGDETWTFGGGSRGRLEFDSPSSTYYSTPAISGCVMVAVPTNLCSSSLYAKTDYVRGDLLQYWDFNNGRTFGKSPYNVLFNSIRDNSKLEAFDTGSTTTEPSSSATLQNQNYLFGNPIKYDEQTPTLLNVYDTQVISGSLTMGNTAFSLEWFGEPSGSTETIYIVNDSSKSGPLANPKIIVTQTGGGRIDYVDHSGTEIQLFGTISDNTDNHVVLTYDNTNLRMYVNGVLTDTEPAAVTSSLSNPTFYLGDAPVPNGDSNFHKLFRCYNDELTSGEVMQNYSASAGL